MSERQSPFHHAAWAQHENVTVVECPACGFCFDADHEDHEGGYSCPMCAEIRLNEALEKLLDWVLQSPSRPSDEILRGWWSRGLGARRRSYDELGRSQGA